MSWRLAAGVAFLGAQVVWRGPLRPWAPFHEHAVYSLQVDVKGQHLDTLAALERYHLSHWYYAPSAQQNWETNELDFVKHVITATELRAGEPVQVRLEARVDGAPVPPWTFTRP